MSIINIIGLSVLVGVIIGYLVNQNFFIKKITESERLLIKIQQETINTLKHQILLLEEDIKLKLDLIECAINCEY